jgi:hypothetical protein
MQQFPDVHYNFFKEKGSIAVKFASPESKYIFTKIFTYYPCFDFPFALFWPIKKKENISLSEITQEILFGEALK